jgi:predicted Zn-dependent peptidase
LAGVGLDSDWLRTHPVRLAQVTVDEVAGAAAEVLAPARFTGVVVGDLASVARGLTALGDVTLP